MEGESRVLGEFTLKKSYLNCLKKIRQFRKALMSDKDIKRGRLYFSWLETKIENDFEDGKISEEECR